MKMAELTNDHHL